MATWSSGWIGYGRGMTLVVYANMVELEAWVFGSTINPVVRPKID